MIILRVEFGTLWRCPATSSKATPRSRIRLEYEGQPFPCIPYIEYFQEDPLLHCHPHNAHHADGLSLDVRLLPALRSQREDHPRHFHPPGPRCLPPPRVQNSAPDLVHHPPHGQISPSNLHHEFVNYHFDCGISTSNSNANRSFRSSSTSIFVAQPRIPCLPGSGWSSSTTSLSCWS